MFNYLYCWFRSDEYDDSVRDFLRACENNCNIHSNLSLVTPLLHDKALYTGLCILCKNGHFDTVKEIFPVVPNKNDEHFCLYIWTEIACTAGQLNIVTWLIEKHNSPIYSSSLYEVWVSNHHEIFVYLAKKISGIDFDIITFDRRVLWCHRICPSVVSLPPDKQSLAPNVTLQRYLNWGFSPSLLPGSILPQHYQLLDDKRKALILIFRDCLDRIFCHDVLSLCITFFSY
jgi:hypothetical protein